MKLSNIIKLTTLFLFSATLPAFAGTANTEITKIDQVSVWAKDGEILVQTLPRHNITGLTCYNNFWLRLKKDEPGYASMLEVLLSAQTTGKNVFVTAEDNNGDQFCKLNRVIIKNQ